MDRLSGKIALVTGAGDGIAGAITEELVKAGVTVYGCDIVVKKVEDMKARLGKQKGELIPIQCDVSKEEEIKAAFDILKKKSGKIDILVNGAGIWRYGYISDGNTKFFKQIYDVNAMAPIICSAEALKIMKETKVDGYILFISSQGGHYVPNVNPAMFNVYNASKFSITGLLESLRQELVHLGSKIRVSAISPGTVRTNFLPNFLAGSGLKEGDIDVSNLQDCPAMEPKDVADLALYILNTPPHVQIHDVIIKPVGERW